MLKALICEIDYSADAEALPLVALSYGKFCAEKLFTLTTDSVVPDMVVLRRDQFLLLMAVAYKDGMNYVPEKGN